MLNTLVSQIAWHSGLSAVFRRFLVGKGRFVLTFHGVASRRYDHIPRDIQPSMCVSEFHAVLTWLSRYFAFLTPQQFVESDDPGVLLTFDDGLANNATYALPILEEFSAPAILFISTKHIQEPTDWLPASRKWAAKGWPDGQYDAVAHELFDGMSEEQLRTVASHPLITIGSHTVSHPFMTQCTDAELVDELGESRRYLQAVCGQSVDYFAYPTNDYDLRVAKATQAAGYKVAFADHCRQAGLPCFEIPRVGLYHFDAPYLSMKLSGLYRAPVQFPIC